MPTYDNNGSTTYVTTAGAFKPGTTGFATKDLLDGLAGITRTADTPYPYVHDGVAPIDYLPPTADAEVGDGVSPGDSGKLTFVADGTLAAGEEISIEYQAASGDWYALVESGLAVVLSADNNVVATDKPGIYRANKPATAAAVGVTVYYR
ncbi:MAG: hypothetical protein ACOY32_15065 [Thermodesulfobacteriota bacterium]